MLISEALEIDLYESRKRYPLLYRGDVRVYVPFPLNKVVYLPLCTTKQRYGRRIWFICEYCNRKVKRLYVVPVYTTNAGIIACRTCHGLKYDSQYRKDVVSRREMIERKLLRFHRQKRQLWYGEKHTQFGKRYFKLKEKHKEVYKEIHEDFQKMRVKLGMPPPVR